MGLFTCFDIELFHPFVHIRLIMMMKMIIIIMVIVMILIR